MSEMDGSGDGEFYGPVGEPLPYPVLEPLPQQGYPVGQAYPGGEPYGPYYPGQEPYAVGAPMQQGYPQYPAQPQLYPGVDLAAGDQQQSPWWLPKRRALVIPNAPVPPADIPQSQSGVW